jgi:hypothetical protein
VPFSDSAGTPFSGRTVPDPGFAGDSGDGNPALLAALAAYAADPGHAPAVAHALVGARVLVPVVAVLAEEEQPAGALRREKATDMALVTLVAPDGRRAVPVFTSLSALAEWRSDARPVPVEAPRAALAAAAEGASALVVDPAGPVRFAVTGALLRALAEGGVEPPLWSDEGLRRELLESLAGVPGLRGLRLEPAPGADARLVLVLAADTDVAAAAAAAGPVLQSNEPLRRRTFTGLDVAVEQA